MIYPTGHHHTSTAWISTVINEICEVSLIIISNYQVEGISLDKPSIEKHPPDEAWARVNCG